MADRLTYMKDYHISRDTMCDIVDNIIGYDLLMDCFCYGQFCDSDEFSWFRSDDEFYIIHKNSGMMINWYKHLGRTNTCSQEDRTVEDYLEFFNKFKEELKHWYEYHNHKMPGIKIKETPQPMFVSVKDSHKDDVIKYFEKNGIIFSVEETYPCISLVDNSIMPDHSFWRFKIIITKSDAVIFQNFLRRLQEERR